MSGQIEGFGGHHSRKKPERNFKVFIHKGEKRQIEEWVLMKDNIETGGDLFGLWIDQHTAVVQFVLGPGEHCKRTTISFYQDVKYLEKAGKYLTEEHGLCNIGQWHSHHRINLPRPSGGDENTVWGNMPNLGLDRYIVFIATIQDVSRKATAGVNCFLFETKNGDRLLVLEGTLEQVQGNTNSPFRLNENICKYTNDGAESVNMLKIIRKTEQSQEILKSGQSHKSNSKETESKVVGTKVAEDRGNKSKTPTFGDQSQITNNKDGSKQSTDVIHKREESHEILKTGQYQNSNSRETKRKFVVVGSKVAEDRGNKSKTSTSGEQQKNRKDTDEEKKKEMGKTNQNKPKHKTKVSPTHKNEGNSQFYSSKSNNDQTEKRTPVPQENHEPVLRKNENRVNDTQTSSGQVPSFNNGDNVSTPDSNNPTATKSNAAICQQPQSSNRSQNKPRGGSFYDNLGGPSTNTADTGLGQGGVEGMTSNHFICNMLEVMAVQDRVKGIPCSHCQKPSVGRCVTCEVFMCEKCFQPHNSYPGFRDHCVLTMEELSKHENRSKITGSSYCKEHESKKLKFFCETCEQLICRYCMDFDHLRHNHECLPLDKVVAQKN